MTPSRPAGPPYADLLAFKLGLPLAPDVREQIVHAMESEPRWQAHLDSIDDLDLDRTSASYDASQLSAFDPREASDFCHLVARTGGTILTPLLAPSPEPVKGRPAEEWLEHVFDCVYCRRMLRLTHAAQVRRHHGMADDEPLLREWLLDPTYRPALDRVTAQLTGAPTPPSPDRSAARLSPPRPAVRLATPDEIEGLARGARSEPEGPALSDLVMGVESTVRAYAWHLVLRGDLPAEQSEALIHTCLNRCRARFRRWNPEEGPFADWLMRLCDEAGRAATLGRHPEVAGWTVPLAELVGRGRGPRSWSGPARQAAVAGILAVDATGVDRLFSEELGVLMRLVKEVRAAKGRLVLINAAAPLRQTLITAGIHELLEESAVPTRLTRIEI